MSQSFSHALALLFVFPFWKQRDGLRVSVFYPYILKFLMLLWGGMASVSMFLYENMSFNCWIGILKSKVSINVEDNGAFQHNLTYY